MKLRIHVAIVFVTATLFACSKSEPPPAATTGQDSHPVKNVERLPSGTIQEGAKTMNNASDLGKILEQQKQDREKNSENK